MQEVPQPPSQPTGTSDQEDSNELQESRRGGVCVTKLIEFPRIAKPSRLGEAIDLLEGELDNLNTAARRKLEKIIDRLLDLEEKM